MKMRFRTLAVTFAAVATLAACGGGGGGGSDTSPPPPPPPPPPPAVGNVIVKITTEASGANCASGGRRIETGIDANGNLQLDTAEIQSTQFLCNGATALTGAPASGVGKALVSFSVEPTGSNCRYGGFAFAGGADANGNGTLDTGEISTREYSCHATMQFVSVTGATQQAAANTGYIANNAAARAVITLPSTGLAAGDQIEVRGSAAGGWRLANNAAQWVSTSLITGTSQGLAFFPAATTADWHTVAITADGSRVVAASNGGRISVSTDGGENWTEVSTPRAHISSAISSTGAKMIVGTFDGQMHISNDGGTTFNATGPVGNRKWSSIAMSANGNVITASAENDTLYRSTDGGATWVPLQSARQWFSVASSTDGQKLVAVANLEQILVSADGGATWAARGTAQAWTSVASSADGAVLVAGASNGRLWRSTDSGLTWVETGPATPKQWRSVTLSANGSRIAAVAYNDFVWVSSDGGQTWASREATRNWWGVTSSADGSRVIAAPSRIDLTSPLPQLYRAPFLSTSYGATGALVGDAASRVLLEYVGNGRWDLKQVTPTVTVE